MHVHWLVCFLQLERESSILWVSANTESKHQKKAFPHRGRSKLITVVVLDKNTGVIPRGVAREKLRSDGRIQDVPFFRYLSYAEVKSLIADVFSLDF